MKTFTLLWIVSLAFTVGAIGQPRFAVMPFDNKANVRGGKEKTALDSDVQHIDRYSILLREEVESWLSQQEGAKIMERAELERILKEIDLQNASGLIDEATVIPYGKAKGITHFVSGTILGISRSATTFKGYGVAAQREVYKIRFRLKIMDILKSELIFSQTYNITIPVQQTGNSANEDSDRIGSLSEKVGEQLDADEKLQTKLKTLINPKGKLQEKVGIVDNEETTGEIVEIKIDPTPNDCDVEIGGVLIGTSPVKAKFPEGRQIVIKVKKAGYHPWEKRVKISDGLTLTPELKKVDPPKTVIVVPVK